MPDLKQYALIIAPGWGTARNGCGEVQDIGTLAEFAYVMQLADIKTAF